MSGAPDVSGGAREGGGLPPRARARLLADLAADSDGPDGPDALLHGRYRVLRELGRGGMGVVHEAEDVALRRRVALKVLSGGMGPGLVELVLREARAAARLAHPGIAAVYDAYADADGYAIALELVDGAPLSALPLPEPRTLARWIRDAARAVHHAHEQGIVHRDLKPANLMLAGERIVVTDFGLAKELAPGPGGGSLSLSGHVIGTPSFMPPEQAGGRAREVDARSDVWALGATLHDRLAGRPPFTGPDVVAVLRAVVEDDPAPLPPSVPRDLARIAEKCLAKEKERRYASAAELADDLERFLDGRPVVARAPSVRYRLARHVRRHRVLVGAAALLALGGLASVAWNAAERAKGAAARAALELVERVAVVLEDATLAGPDDPGRAAALDATIAACEAHLARHPSAIVEAKLGRLLRERQRYPDALAAFERALALDPANAAARLERGLLGSYLEAARRGAGERSDELDALAAAARADLAAALESRDLRRLDRERGLAELARLDGRLDEARRRWEEIERVAPHVETPPALAALALAAGDPDEAFRQAMSAVDLQRGFAPAYAARSDPEAALERAIRQHARSAGPDDGRLAIEGLAGRFTDWSARLARRTSTALAYANRATDDLARAGRALAAAEPEAALAALDDAIGGLGNALTIEPTLADALGDRALAEAARAEILDGRGEPEEARLARERARADLDRALALAPDSVALRDARALVDPDEGR